jgi:hypothetical protein
VCDLKKGDKVKCMTNNYTFRTLTIGKIYEVLFVNETKHTCSIDIVNDNCDVISYGCSRFELVDREIDFLKILTEFS